MRGKDIRPRVRRKLPLAERFETKVDRDGPMPDWHPEYGQCWDWTAATYPNGYGMIGVGGRDAGTTGAHIAAWQLASRAPVPDGLMVGHTCDRKRCVRNDSPGVYLINGHEFPRWGHLWLGTVEDNNADMRAKGRYGWQADPERFRRALSRPRPHKYNGGTSNAHAKLTDALVLEILQRFGEGGISKATLGRQYGVSEVLIGRLVRRQAWRHLT